MLYILGMTVKPVILSIAGHDPSSGAGITADAKTAAAFDCYALTCVTTLTVQSTQGVFDVQRVEAELVGQVIGRLSDDMPIAAVRIGMLGSGEVASVVADFLRSARISNVVLDPVLRSSSGANLIDSEGLEAVRSQLLPLCDVITPNVEEAAQLAGEDAGALSQSWEGTLPHLRDIAAKLHDLGSRRVVITGGDFPEPNDYLSISESGSVSEQTFPGTRLVSTATHGTGCAFATALACGLAKGSTLPEAIVAAKNFVRQAILSAYPIGKGTGPMNHLFRLEKPR